MFIFTKHCSKQTLFQEFITKSIIAVLLHYITFYLDDENMINVTFFSFLENWMNAYGYGISYFLPQTTFCEYHFKTMTSIKRASDYYSRGHRFDFRARRTFSLTNALGRTLRFWVSCLWRNWWLLVSYLWKHVKLFSVITISWHSFHVIQSTRVIIHA